MTHASAVLARSITWKSSKQSYLTARLLADRDLSDDCLRAYAYFRWADDTIDVALTDQEARTAFVERQKALIWKLYTGKRPGDLSPEEQMLADLIAHDRGPDRGLRSFIVNFMAVLEIDAGRRGRLVSRSELVAYTSCLATAVMDGLQYFIGNGHPYPHTPERTLAVVGAHITHMLRDLRADLADGLVNVPAETLQARGLNLEDVEDAAFRQWVREQVEAARAAFHRGQGYIDSLDLLRCKLAGVWYCARFARVLDVIERDGYRLRREYACRHAPSAWLEMAWLGVVVTLKHCLRPIRPVFSRLHARAG
jgi:phytoene/squalene synthetase